MTAISLETLQIEEGSTATAYEPPAPTPDYPIEIHSLNDFDVVSSVGKRNLIRGTEDNISWWTSGYPSDASERTKGKITVLRDDTVIGTWNSLSQNLENGIKSIDSDGDYTLSVDLKISHPPILNGYIDLQFRDMTGSRGKTGQTSINDLPSNEWTRVSVYVPRTQGYVLETMYSYITGVYPIGTTIEYKDLKLEKGNRSTPWAPSLEYATEDTNHPLIDKINLLLSEPLRSVGDVKDRLFRDNSDGLWKVERSVGEIILDGSISFGVIVNTNPEYSSYLLYGSANIAATDIAVMAKMVSSHYPFFEHSGAAHYSTREGQQIRNYMDTSASIIITDYTMTHAEFQNKLRDSPVTLVYEKRNPEMETLDQDLQDKLNNLRSFQDSNYVYTVINEKYDLPSHISENLKPQTHTEFLAKDHFKESRTVNNLLIWNRSLGDEELLNQNKLFHERFNMRSDTIKGEPINQTVNLLNGGMVGHSLEQNYTIKI